MTTKQASGTISTSNSRNSYDEIATRETNTPSSNRKQPAKFLKEEIPKPFITGGFNVVLTHCTADFDSLASAVGLAKLWSNEHPNVEKESTEFQSSQKLPTFVVLPRGAHPSVNKFLALHKHLFPIRSLRSLPGDLTGLNRLGLVDAQKRERVGPAEHLISYANRVTIVDHHIEGDSDIPEATDYVVDKVGSVSAMIAEQLKDAGLELTEAEATLLALGIHADTGSLCYDSTTVRDANALAWVMSQGASQAAIAEHAHSTLSQEQQGVLTNALINTNSTVVHGVTVSTALLR
jgi:tRNA nucleotidyltransferase (CCA-adding enzyme)